MESQQHFSELEKIEQLFKQSTGLLLAIGDETRQHIILKMLELPCEVKGGVRVGEITKRTNLSRPAVSHHLKILKEVGLVGMRKDGTKNYYFLTADVEALEILKDLSETIHLFIKKINQT